MSTEDIGVLCKRILEHMKCCKFKAYELGLLLEFFNSLVAATERLIKKGGE